MFSYVLQRYTRQNILSKTSTWEQNILSLNKIFESKHSDDYHDGYHDFQLVWIKINSAYKDWKKYSHIQTR